MAFPLENKSPTEKVFIYRKWPNHRLSEGKGSFRGHLVLYRQSCIIYFWEWEVWQCGKDAPSWKTSYTYYFTFLVSLRLLQQAHVFFLDWDWEIAKQRHREQRIHLGESSSSSSCSSQTRILWLRWQYLLSISNNMIAQDVTMDNSS